MLDQTRFERFSLAEERRVATDSLLKTAVKYPRVTSTKQVKRWVMFFVSGTKGRSPEQSTAEAVGPLFWGRGRKVMRLPCKQV